MGTSFTRTLELIERLHRQCLEVVKAELDRLAVRDLTSVQAVILFNIGRDEFSIGDLTQRGYYLGSNVSYNIKKMIKHGYLLQARSTQDRRLLLVRASPAGVEIHLALDSLFEAHASNELIRNQVSEDCLNRSNEALRNLHGIWASQSRAR
ncbi:helix-turn-helix domain-containing protein [Denitrobaculum tricleocarpae]|uniref:MarR family transcriptional regulator n=1 Tax=Denitrobaculum tricleocarpae TaxID=2591009 RepID=A0A545SYL9_9PROT|nr:MarR family transcriptional regulator [Denitrobaculum tricleocarpae]TQV70064.1 MarR family transcriptional regulator [Denitrobaculum tricleocarpae]